MLIAIILFIPLVLGILSLLMRKVKALGIINAFGYGLLFACAISYIRGFLRGPSPLHAWGWLYIDSLGLFFMLTASAVAFAASIYSIGYIGAEMEEGRVGPRKARGYFLLFNLFCFAMLCALFLNNLALTWIAIEMTTLVSAFLVGFHNVKESIEAAWKYIIICSVGIIFALLGIIFFYYTSLTDAGIRSLEWAKMLQGAHLFNPRIVKVALLLIFVGYGTKAGFAPMHNWLPDAHSQALSPISGLLSGVLLKISLYAILRFVMLSNLSVGYGFSAKLFILFGICSLGVAAGFILVQKDLKRLFAYSSVENIGLIAVGFGLSSFGGIFAGLLHGFNHAVTKAFLFFCAGNAAQAYRTNNMNKMQGMIQLMPFTGLAMFLGVFALAGMPPFSIFISKVLILMAAFQGRHYVVAASVLVFIAIAFAGLLGHISRVILGNRPQSCELRKETLSVKIALSFLGIFMLGVGLRIPQPLFNLLTDCQKLILGK